MSADIAKCIRAAVTLPPKALTVLIDLKKELLSRDLQLKTTANEEPRRASRVDGAAPQISQKKLRPQRVNGYQRMCQRRDWASPVY
jgi:hypothetical protein